MNNIYYKVYISDSNVVVCSIVISNSHIAIIYYVINHSYFTINNNYNNVVIHKPTIVIKNKNTILDKIIQILRSFFAM